MKRINHPLFGKVGAFWIEGHPKPFYGISEATEYQKHNGGDILDTNGRVLYPQPQAPEPTEPTPVPNQKLIDPTIAPSVKEKNKGWFARLTGR